MFWIDKKTGTYGDLDDLVFLESPFFQHQEEETGKVLDGLDDHGRIMQAEAFGTSAMKILKGYWNGNSRNQHTY